MVKVFWVIVSIVFAEIFLHLFYNIQYPHKQEVEKHYKKGKYQIICVGDSIVNGVGAKDLLNTLAPQIERLTGMKTLNAGMNSETSRDVLHRVKYLVTLKPEIIIVQSGTNDKFYYEYPPFWAFLRKSYLFRLLSKPFPRPSYTVLDFWTNMEEIYWLCQTHGVRLIMTTINLNPHDSRVNIHNAILRQYPETVEIHLESKHFFDNVHLNDEGYKEFARQVAKRIKESQ